jgi:hypothetical protein
VACGGVQPPCHRFEEIIGELFAELGCGRGFSRDVVGLGGVPRGFGDGSLVLVLSHGLFFYIF